MQRNPPVLRRVSRFLQSHRRRLADELGESLFAASPEAKTRFGTYGLNATKQQLERYLDSLINTMALETPKVFAEDLYWFKGDVERFRIDPLSFEQLVIMARSFLAEAMPGDEAEAVKDFFDEAWEPMRQDQAQHSFIAETNPLRELALRFLNLLLDDRRGIASALLYAGVKSGIPLPEIYLHVLQPVQYEVGRLWATGKISVAREQYSTTAVLSIMSELYPYLTSIDEADKDRTIVLASVDEESHTLALRMLGDFLEMDGWKVRILTGEISSATVKEALSMWDASLLALSTTMSNHLLEMEEIITAVQASPELQKVAVMVGGRTFALDETLYEKIGAQGWARNAGQAVQVANDLHEQVATRGENRSRRRRPAGTIWWHGEDHLPHRILRDDLAFNDELEAAELPKIRRLVASVKHSGGPQKTSLCLKKNGRCLEKVFYLDAVKYDQTVVTALAESPTDLEFLLGEGTQTLKGLNEVMSLPSFDDENGPPSPVAPYRGLSGLTSELAALQRELVVKTIRLEELQQDRSRLLAMAAHDMRNALAAIDANSYLLWEILQDLDIPGHAFRHIQSITHSSEYLLSLTGDLQELARLESTHPEMKYIDLLELIDEGVNNAWATGAQKRVAVKLIADSSLPPILADPTSMNRLIDNLLSNAVKFSPPGSTVYVGATAKKERIVFTVKDEGPGIAEEEIDQLFDLFFLGRARPTAGERSTGLGLPIVKRIVDLHDGRIEIDSTLGVGTTFTISLPTPDDKPEN